MLGFLRRGKKRLSTNTGRRERTAITIQSRLNSIHTQTQENEKRPTFSDFSLKNLENEVDKYLKDFQSYVKNVKETSLGLEELTKLVKSGEISENAYRLLMDELGNQLSASIEEIFKLRETLELARGRAKLEWAKEKVGAPGLLVGSTSSMEPWEDRDLRRIRAYSDTIQSDYSVDSKSDSKIYFVNLQRWETLISKIDSVLSSLPIEDEAAIIEQYLSIIREKVSLGERSAEIEKGLAVCRQRLNSISEKWASMRRVKIEKIMNLELEASKIKDEIKELEVRFSVGEITQQLFENKMSFLQANLKKVENDVNDVRRFIDDMDMKIFRCSELLREGQ